MPKTNPTALEWVGPARNQRAFSNTPNGHVYIISYWSRHPQYGEEGYALNISNPKKGTYNVGFYPTKTAAKREAQRIEDGDAPKSNPVKKSRQNRAKTAPKSNPVTTRDAKVKEAAKTRRAFRARAGVAARLQSGQVTDAEMHVDDVQFSVGKVLAVEYEIVDDKGRPIRGQAFRHEFTGKSRPMLTSSHDGRQLYFIGGSYHFKNSGINDI